MIENGIEGLDISFVPRDVNAFKSVHFEAIAAFSISAADLLDLIVEKKQRYHAEQFLWHSQKMRRHSVNIQEQSLLLTT
jgi:hypothetical protein